MTNAKSGHSVSRSDSPSGRGKRQNPLLELRTDLPRATQTTLSIAGVIGLLGVWTLAATVFATEGFAVPTIPETLAALRELWEEGTLIPDFLASIRRVAIGYTVSILIGITFGTLIGSFSSVESFLGPELGFLRYVPATALTPLFLIWLGIDEAPKIALVIVGTVFYNILMISDVVRQVPSELIRAAYTLGASRRTVVRRVILPHSWPGMIDVARINLAAAWLMLVVAELLAAQEGLAFRIIRAQRFRRVDRMFALLLVFGLLGIASDWALRYFRNRSASWAKDVAS